MATDTKAAGLTATFNQDKETDNTFRFTAKADAATFAGSIYVPKALMPEGTTKAIVTVRFE